ncbi:hypothetical protein Taro_054601 [Colocasia esculenta]|uniref:Uncharacterized protein n=1 Tax=Colocasia esculenta TaxID=4460 RepID=A0A843XPA5_COLES|nr:hypothetical protein [Colocasia esculenta]
MVAVERLVFLLDYCRSPRYLRQVLAQAVASGLRRDGHLSPKVVAAFFESGHPEDARRWFDGVVFPNTVLWNVMFKGYTLGGAHGNTLALFARMRGRGVSPNRYTFTFVLKSCAKIPATRTGTAVHGVVVKAGFEENWFVGTLLIDVYSAVSEGGDIGSARKVFDGMPFRNVVAWTAMVSAYVSACDVVSGRRLFDSVSHQADLVLWNTMVSGYIEAGNMDAARELFDKMPERDIMAWNTILHGYANGVDFEACLRFFNEMPQRNIFSWNGLFGGYVRHELFTEALCAFNSMLKASDIKPNDATLVMVLSACSKVGAIYLGRWIHIYAANNGFMENLYVVNGLIDMYAKCGSIRNAIELFNMTKTKDIITWNIIIGGLAMHGQGSEALNLFEEMKVKGVAPDGVTFVRILFACSHMGLVQRGFAYFRSMINYYSITPWIEHYGCVVDLLSRAGMLDEALNFIKKMPIEADCVIWSTLLGACRIYGDIHLAEFAVKQLVRLQPEDAANYVTLSNIYGATGSWKHFARAKQLMKEWNVEKSPGCSLIEINYVVTEFRSSDVRHPQTMEIYKVLDELTALTRSVSHYTGIEGLCSTEDGNS